MNGIFPYHVSPYYDNFEDIPIASCNKFSQKLAVNQTTYLSSNLQYNVDYASLGYCIEKNSPSSCFSSECPSEGLGVTYNGNDNFSCASKTPEPQHPHSQVSCQPLDPLLFTPQPYYSENRLLDTDRSSFHPYIDNFLAPHYPCIKTPVVHNLYTVTNQTHQPTTCEQERSNYNYSIEQAHDAFPLTPKYSIHEPIVERSLYFEGHGGTAEKEDPARWSNRNKSRVPHAPQETYSCMHSGCDKVFARPYNLKSHMRIHSSDRPYECSFKPCVWKFARPHDLKRHELQHTGVKPHTCKYCTRSFARSDALKRHLKVDSSCSQAFRNDPSGYKSPKRGRKKGSGKNKSKMLVPTLL